MTEENNQKLQQIIEGAILAAGEALSVDRLLSLFEESERPEKEVVVGALKSIQEQHEGRGFGLIEVASGWRFQVQPNLAQWVNRLWEEKPQKYSRALLETLALIAYRQPLTRSDIEEVRGVAVSSHIIKTLAEREWIKVVGHRDVPGRPSLYATTRQFLDYFGLKSLDELPTLGELKDIDGLNARLELEDDELRLEQEQIAEAKAGESAANEEAPANSEMIDTDGAESVDEAEAADTSLEFTAMTNSEQPQNDEEPAEKSPSPHSLFDREMHEQEVEQESELSEVADAKYENDDNI